MTASSASADTQRVAYLTSQYPAPSHTFIRREIASLRGMGLSITPYSVRQGQSLDDRAERVFTVLSQPWYAYALANGRAFFRAPVRYLSALRLALRHRVPGLKALVWSVFHFVEAMVLADRLRRDRIDRLHSHFANSAAIVGMVAADYLQMPWSITLHGISEFDYPAGLLLPAKLARAEFVACVSYFGMAQAMRVTPTAIWPRLTLVRCAIDPDDLPQSPREKAEGARLNLVCVGRLSPEKGQAGLIRVVAELVARDMQLHLTLVGDGPERASLDALVARYDLARHITFLGMLPEAATLAMIAGADALVLPSFMEGLPIVLMEALALGVPVIASNVAGIPELVRHGSTGLLFSPANWSQLREALISITDPELRRSLGEAGRKRVLAEFTYPDAALPLARLLNGPTDV